jgi:hypothetical protein
VYNWGVYIFFIKTNTQMVEIISLKKEIYPIHYWTCDRYDLAILTPSKNKMVAFISWISKSTICRVQITNNQLYLWFFFLHVTIFLSIFICNEACFSNNWPPILKNHFGPSMCLLNFKKHDLSCSDHDHGFCLSSIKIYFEIGIWLFSNKHAALREKTYDKTVNYWLLDGWYPHVYSMD